jgi:hypothetical protein
MVLPASVELSTVKVNTVWGDAGVDSGGAAPAYNV